MLDIHQGLVFVLGVFFQAKNVQEAFGACNLVLEEDEHDVEALCDRAEAYIANEEYDRGEVLVANSLLCPRFVGIIVTSHYASKRKSVLGGQRASITMMQHHHHVASPHDAASLHHDAASLHHDPAPLCHDPVSP